MPFCRSCGNEVVAGARFCRSCGTEITGNPSATKSPPPDPQAVEAAHAPDQVPNQNVSGSRGKGWYARREVVSGAVIVAIGIAIAIFFLRDHPRSASDYSTGNPETSSTASKQLHLIDIGTLGGISSFARGINNAGQVVGYITMADKHDHAFLYSNGKMQDLGTLGGSDSKAYDINDSGQIVGWSITREGTGRAFLYSDGKMQDIGTLGMASEAISINNDGQIVGSSYIDSETQHPFLYSNGQMQDLGSVGGDICQATAINDEGQVIGYSKARDGTRHVFLYSTSSGTMQDLSAIANECDFRGINNRGDIVGSYEPISITTPSPELRLQSPLRRAFLYSTSLGKLHDLGPAGSRSSAVTINDAGQAAGEVQSRPVLFAGGKAQHIEPSGKIEGFAAAINQHGQVAGYTQMSDGSTHAFVSSGQ